MDEREPEEQPEKEPLAAKAELPEEPQASQDDSARGAESAEIGNAIPEMDSQEPVSAEAEAEEERETSDSPRAEDVQPGPEEGEPVAVEAEESTVVESRPSLSASSGRRASSSDVPPETSAEPAWYVIHCYSGYENKVRHNLEQRIETMGMKDKIFDVVIPTQEEIEVKEGKRRTVERHIFPGYVLVNMSLSEESWYVVRNTPGVTGFVGMGNLPTALRPEEVAQIVKRMEAEAPTVKVSFKEGERVRIIDGPFNDFRGTVSEIDMERTKVRVMVSFFGRETPVELDFLQVEKA